MGIQSKTERCLVVVLMIKLGVVYLKFVPGQQMQTCKPNKKNFSIAEEKLDIRWFTVSNFKRNFWTVFELCETYDREIFCSYY